MQPPNAPDETGRRDAMARGLAAIVAVIAAIGLVLQFDSILAAHDTVSEALWIYLRFFTNITNMLVMLAFAAIAVRGADAVPPRPIAGLTLAILLVGVVYGLLLQGLHHFTGGGLVADILLHKVVPVLVPLYWLAQVRKGRVQPADPLRWAIYPFLYLFYALAHGLAGDKYAYPFIDPTKHGWPAVWINVAAIAIGFMIAGYGLYRLDRHLAARNG